MKKFDHHTGSSWKSDRSPGLFHPYLDFFLCGLWLSHHLSFLFPSDLKGMQNNTDPRNRFGLYLILSNREFKQLKRVTESICSKNMGISEKNSVRIWGRKAAVLPSSPSPFNCCCCPSLSHFPPFWKLLSILCFCVPFLLQLALPLPRRLLLFPNAGFFRCLHHKACVALHANSQAWDQTEKNPSLTTFHDTSYF